MALAEYQSLPFREQIAFFRRKLSLPSEDWTQLWQQGHDHAFVVAGAHSEALVADLRSAVDQVIAGGATLRDFRADFDRVVAEHGWSYKGGRGWRTRVIYETNLRTSYAAGRYRQLQAVSEARPYWLYRHSDAVTTPRPQHLAWDGLVLAADDPWWQTHYPPNGWGCKCRVLALSARDLARMGKDAPDEAPPVQWREVTVGTRGAHPRTVRVPAGIDPGFAYAPGATSWAAPLAEEAAARGAAYRAGEWERLLAGDWSDAGRPARLPLYPPPADLGRRATDVAGIEAQLRTALGAPMRVFDMQGLPVTVDAQALARHIDPNRAEFAPWLPDLLRAPAEVWLQLERHARTGYYQMRVRALKAYDAGDGRHLLAVAQQGAGMLEAWTVIPTTDLRYIQRQRSGLLWSAAE